jgi:hypothetical protein
MVTSLRSFGIVDDRTVQEKRDQQERPSKRQRAESDKESEKVNSKAKRDGSVNRRIPTTTSFSSGTPIVEEPAERDPTYFKEVSGLTLFVRVKNTLFRVWSTIRFL